MLENMKLSYEFKLLTIFLVIVTFNKIHQTSSNFQIPKKKESLEVLEKVKLYYEFKLLTIFLFIVSF